jgi:hypothetical protein
MVTSSSRPSDNTPVKDGVPATPAPTPPWTPNSAETPSDTETIPLTCTLILDFHQDQGITCGTTSFDLSQIYSVTTNSMVNDINETMLELIHDAIECSQILTVEERAVLFSLKLNEISFHHRESGKLICFLLKHMAKKIRTCLLLRRSCVFCFHVVFRDFTPELVRRCSHAPLSAMLPTRTFIGTGTKTTPAETALNQSETLPNTRGLFHRGDGDTTQKDSLQTPPATDHPPDSSGPPGQPYKVRWPNVDASCIGEFDRNVNGDGSSRGLASASNRRPPNDFRSANKNADPGQSFRAVPPPGQHSPILHDGLGRDQQHSFPSYRSHYGFGPPSPATPGYARLRKSRRGQLRLRVRIAGVDGRRFFSPV